MPIFTAFPRTARSEEHTSELQSQSNLVCRLLLEKKKKHIKKGIPAHLIECVHAPVRLNTHSICLSCADLLRIRQILTPMLRVLWIFFFFNDTATTEIYTLSLHDALPI